MLLTADSGEGAEGSEGCPEAVEARELPGKLLLVAKCEELEGVVIALPCLAPPPRQQSNLRRVEGRLWPHVTAAASNSANNNAQSRHASARSAQRTGMACACTRLYVWLQAVTQEQSPLASAASLAGMADSVSVLDRPGCPQLLFVRVRGYLSRIWGHQATGPFVE